MLKRILHGLCMEIGALCVLVAGIFFVHTFGKDAGMASAAIGLSCAVAWSVLTVWAILVSFDLVGS